MLIPHASTTFMYSTELPAVQINSTMWALGNLSLPAPMVDQSACRLPAVISLPQHSTLEGRLPYVKNGLGRALGLSRGF